MEADRFDILARSLTFPGSRRSALGGLVGGALGFLVSQTEQTLARKRKGKGKKRKNAGLTCPSGYTACGQQCVDVTDNTLHRGACFVACSPGKVCCNGACANLQDDDNHCAACGRRCLTRDEETPRRDAAEICSNGACLECSLEGFLDDGKPPRCCRGLTQCPAKDTLPARCFPADRPCP